MSESAKSETSTFGIAGHGLLLSPICPCRVLHLEDNRLFASRDGAGVTLLPTSKGVSFSFAGRATRIEDLFLRVDRVEGQVPWMLLGPGFWIGFPSGFAVFGSAPDEKELFELHLLASGQELEPGAFIGLQLLAGSASGLRIDLQPGFRETARGTVDSEGGPVKWSEVAYRHAGEAWLRRYYALPVGDDETLLFNAGAREPVAPRLFAGADESAQRFAPI